MWYVSLFNQQGSQHLINGEELTAFATLEEANLFILDFTNKRFPHLNQQTLKTSTEVDKKTGKIYRILFDFSVNGLDKHQDKNGITLSESKSDIKSGIIYSENAAHETFKEILLEGNSLTPLAFEVTKNA